MKFEKTSTSIPDQIELLKRRGMSADDEPRARHYLNFISYYRLRAYWLPFEVPAKEDGDHAFGKELVSRMSLHFTSLIANYVSWCWMPSNASKVALRALWRTTWR